MFSAFVKLLEHGLSIADTKLKNKYVDRVVYLKKKYYEEYNKPDGKRNNAVLDNIEHELCIIAETVATYRK